MEKLITTVLAIVLAFILAFPLAWVTQYAWNHSVAEIFHLQEIDFWQAFCLNILGGALFK
jgi:hypothetical protein